MENDETKVDEPSQQETELVTGQYSNEQTQDIESMSHEQKSSPTNPPTPKNKKKLIIGIIAVLFIGGGVAAYLAQNNKQAEQETATSQQEVISIEGKDIQTVDNQSFADKFIPNYSDMRGYVEHEGEHWYATFTSIIITKNNNYRIYSSRQFKDITSFTGMLIYQDEIWLSGQGGAAKRVSDTEFKEYLSGELNVELYFDKFDNKLYASTFNEIFEYDNASDSFVSIDMRSADGQNIDLGFNENYIIAAEIGTYQSTDSVREYNKQTKVWENVAVEFGSTGPSAIMTIDDLVLIFGRSTGYESCEQAGVIAASNFYQIESNGSETQLPDLQEVFKNNEATVYSASSKSLKGMSSCEDDSLTNEFIVDLTVESGKIVASNKRGIEDSLYGYISLYPEKIAQLEAEVGFAQTMYLSQSLANADYSVWLKSGGTYELYSASNVVQKVSRKIGESTTSTIITECNGNEYAVVGSGRSGDYGSPYLVSIYKLNGSQAEKVYETTNETLYEGVAAEMTLVNPEAICLDGKLVMLSESDLGTFDPANNTFTKKPHGFKTTLGMSQINASRDAFIFIDSENKKLVTAGATITSIPVDASAILSGENVFNSMLFVANNEVVVFTQQNEKETTRLATISAKDGSKIEVTDVTGRTIAGGVSFNETSHILQYNDGETKIIDNKTHKASAVISKEPSKGENDSFPIVKSLESAFLIRDGHLWFTAENWGIIAYKLP